MMHLECSLTLYQTWHGISRQSEVDRKLSAESNCGDGLGCDTKTTVSRVVEWSMSRSAAVGWAGAESRTVVLLQVESE